MTLVPTVGLWGRAAGKTAESFRGLRATCGAPRGAARQRCRRRSPDIRPDASRLIAIVKWFRRSCRAENGGTKQPPESDPEEMSFPVLAPRAKPIPSVRGLRRTRRSGSSAGLRISLRGSNRVTCGGEKDSFSAREESYQEAEQHAHNEPDKLVTVEWEMISAPRIKQGFGQRQRWVGAPLVPLKSLRIALKRKGDGGIEKEKHEIVSAPFLPLGYPPVSRATHFRSSAELNGSYCMSTRAK